MLPSLEIIPSSASCQRWSTALAGRVPARKKTTGAGVKFQKALQLHFMVVIEEVVFLLPEDKGCKTA